MAQLIALLLALLLSDGFARDFRSEARVKWDDKSHIQTIAGHVATTQGILHYEIHAHPRDRVYVEQVMQVLRDDAPAVIKYFEYVPDEILHFIINDDDTLPNGSATVFPRNLIVLNTYPPVGHDYLASEDGFIRGLVLHELVHILHMDQTSGIIAVARTIFGSVGKLGGVVPSWFAEGIATWAESHFTQGGRLKSRRLDYALKHFLTQADACRRLDCLDEPGDYPHGNLAYWAGARFLEFLEKRNEGTVRCLIRSNSDNLPFFLNSAFVDCTGMTATDAFELFINSYAPIKSEQNTWWPQGKTRVNFQKGLVISGDELVFVTEERGAQRVRFVNLVSKKSREVRLPVLVHQLRYSNKAGQVILSAMNHRPTETVREWWQIDGHSLEVKKLGVPQGISIDYIFDDFQVRQEDHRFELWQGNKKLKTFAPLVEIKNIGSDQGKLWWNSYHPQNPKPFKLETLNGVRFSHDKPFDVLTSCEGKFLLRDHAGLILLSSQSQRVSNKDDIAEIVSGERYQVILSDKQLAGPRILASSCQVIFDKLQVSGPVTSHNRPVAKEVAFDSESYPSLHHFKPHYWLLGYQAGDNVSSWIASTSINDPVNRHTFFLNGYYYPSISKVAPDVSYTYDFNSWYLQGTYSLLYTETGLGNQVDKSSATTVSLAKEYEVGAWHILPSLYHSWQKTDDFISNRQTRESGMRFKLIAPPLLGDQLFQLTALYGRVFHSNTTGHREFWGGQGRLESSMRLFAPTWLHAHTTYGRLAKSGFRSGVLYGGGFNDIYSANFHEFYGLRRNEAFGNTIHTARLQLDQELMRVFRSSGLTPFYLKTLHLLAGADWLHTDVIFLKDQFVRNRDIISYHAGAKFKMDLFYLAPMDVELIYSQVDNPVGSDIAQWMLLVKGSIFP